MSRLIIVEPMPIAGVVASGGSGAANLRTPDPREVWAAASGGGVLTIDLGSTRVFDTIFLGYVSPPVAATTLGIAAGVAHGAEYVIENGTSLRVPDVAGHAPTMTHALYSTTPRTARYINLYLGQPAGEPPLTVGVLVVGKAFVAELGQEWGSGRRPIDTGSATPLPSGGFAVVEGAHKRHFSWTFGDLSEEEADRLELIALALGETKPGLVVEDPARTPGLRSRIHYGLFERWRPYERRNKRQTRWEIGIEEWV